MLIGEMVSHFRQQLAALMEISETEAVTARVFEHLLSMKRVDLVLRQQEPLKADHEAALLQCLSRLITGEPVQYVLGSAPFCGMDLEVTPDVLIPRPETEELVQWILEDTEQLPVGRLVDFGTGSGCIPIAFARCRQQWSTAGIDSSAEALKVAERNAARLAPNVHFFRLDMLAYDAADAFPASSLSVMVSNPPYIPLEEADSLPRSVSAFEPSAALFTPEEEPLLYYRALQRLAAVLLVPGGSLYLEVHERYARQTLRLFQDDSFSTAELRTDLSGKHRMIRARKSVFA